MRNLPTALLLALGLAACTKPATPATAAEKAAPAPAAAPKAMPPGHPALAAGSMPPELAQKAKPLQEKMNAEPRSFEAAAALGDLYYDNARYPEAVDTYRLAGERAKDVLDLFDELVAQRPAAKVACALASKEVGALDQKARELRDRKDAAGALSCARAAIAPVLAATSRRATALFLVGNVDTALAEYDKVLTRDPDAPDALFFTGALLVNRRGAGAPELARAAKTWKHYLEVAPKDHPRRPEVDKTLPQVEAALAKAPAEPAQPPAGHPPAGGMPPGMAMGEGHPSVGGMPPGMAMDEGQPSVGGMPQGMGEGHPGGEAPVDVDKALAQAEAALAQGDGAAAARLYMGAMNARPDDGRVQAGLAASQFLKGSAMAERVFNVAAARDPKAVDELAGCRRRATPGWRARCCSGWR